MQLKNLIYAAALVTLTVLACQKEVSLTSMPGINNPATINAAITGRIVNETGLPVQGAVVKAGTASASTNVNGEFTITNATVVDRAAYLTAEKTGYFTGSRTFIARAGQKHYVEIELLPKTNSGTINAATGGTIILTNTGAVTLPANAVVVKSTGAAYTGNVQVAMVWIDPTSDKLMRQMPGDLRGIDEANTEVGLQSFGMLGVELTSPAGEKLQIATGKKATLNFPLPTSIVGAAPATIALWYFNETKGLWKQEGIATKTGTAYTAEVSHFSFWNCDAPFPQVQFSAKFTNQTSQPLKHALVKIKRVSTGSYSSGYTDTTGYVAGIVPKNEALVLEVYGSYNCNQLLYTQNIGPFSTNTNLGTVAVTVAAINTFTIAGTVINCSSAPVTAGYVHVNTGGFSSYRAPIINGSFTLTFTSCATTTQPITYYAVDSTAAQQSAIATATVNTGTTNIGSITACGTSTQRYINFTIDGIAYTITSPPDSTMGYSLQSGGVIGSRVTGSKIGNTANPFVSINFECAANAVTTTPLTRLFINVPTLTDSTTLQTGAINLTITEYGAVNGFITGSFNGNLTGSGSTLHPVTCSFRVRKEL